MDTSHTRARARTRSHLLIATIAALIGVLAYSYTPPSAEAHTPRCAQIAVAQALADPRPATPELVREYRLACLRRAARHAQAHRVTIATRRCVRVRGSVLGARVCHALARAAVERRVDSWAWSPALHELLRRESSGDPDAVNERSGACGLFQRLPCPWRYYGGTASPRDDRVWASPLVQARNGLRYICCSSHGYRTPERALAAHNSQGWY